MAGQEEVASYEQMVREMRKVFLSGRTRDLKFRTTQLRRLLQLVEENLNAFYEALSKDLRKPQHESMISDVGYLLRDIRHALQNFKNWAKPTTAPKHLYTPFDKYTIQHDPYGLVLIIAPWNYISLAFSPLVGAIAAGNCAIIKPSEVSKHSEALIMKLIPLYLDDECYKVVVGGPTEMSSLLLEKFDYIFYTGSFNIAQIIHAAANKYLTPVTLELGGKSPAYVDDSVNFRMTAQRLIWGKFSNAGQTCIAPDYILCSKAVQIKLVEQFKKVLDEFYGSNRQDNKDLARIINVRHWSRLRSVLKRSKGDIVIGGEMDEYDLWISPTIIGNVGPSDSLMEGEIFGPLLPIVTVNSVEDAISFINERDRPLALYVYTKKSDVIKLFKGATHSGGLSVNDCLYHCSVFDVPFGGVGESGMGRYHGKWSFDTFSYERAVVHRTFEPIGNLHSYLPRYPPYTSSKYRIVELGTRYFEHFYIQWTKYLTHIFCFIIGIGLAFGIMYLKQNGWDITKVFSNDKP